MSFQTNYKETLYEGKYVGVKYVINENKSIITTLKDEDHCACFASVFSALNLQTFIECDVYIKEYYSKYKLDLTEVDLLNWLDVIAEIGLKFEYLGTIPDLTLPNLEKDKLIWGIRVKKENNNTQSVKLCLNLIRELYEHNVVVKEFYILKKLLPKADDIELIHLAGMITCNTGGHGHYPYYPSYLTNQEIIKEKYLKAHSTNTTTNELNIIKRTTANPKWGTNEEKIEAYKQLKEPIKELVK